METLDRWLQDEFIEPWLTSQGTPYWDGEEVIIPGVLASGARVEGRAKLGMIADLCGLPTPQRAADVIASWSTYRCSLPKDHDCPHIAVAAWDQWHIVSLSFRRKLA